MDFGNTGKYRSPPDAAARIGGYGLSAAALLLIGGFNLYVFVINQTNHTGFDPGFLVWVFLAGALASLVLLISGRRRRRLATAAMVLFLLGAAQVILCQKLGLMLEYENWIRRGMPDKWGWLD